jgi:predicted nucleic acid-binding protein
LFILLDKINSLILLHQLFDKIYTTPKIASEFGKPFPEWVLIQSVADAHYQTIFELEVDRGEASA